MGSSPNSKKRVFDQVNETGEGSSYSRHCNAEEDSSHSTYSSAEESSNSMHYTLVLNKKQRFFYANQVPQWIRTIQLPSGSRAFSPPRNENLVNEVQSININESSMSEVETIDLSLHSVDTTAETLTSDIVSFNHTVEKITPSFIVDGPCYTAGQNLNGDMFLGVRAWFGPHVDREFIYMWEWQGGIAQSNYDVLGAKIFFSKLEDLRIPGKCLNKTPLIFDPQWIEDSIEAGKREPLGNYIVSEYPVSPYDGRRYIVGLNGTEPILSIAEDYYRWPPSPATVEEFLPSPSTIRSDSDEESLVGEEFPPSPSTIRSNLENDDGVIAAVIEKLGKSICCRHNRSLKNNKRSLVQEGDRDDFFEEMKDTPERPIQTLPLRGVPRVSKKKKVVRRGVLGEVILGM
ncbi:hypothetical protein G9A89_017710 [Geosiphon pyriformis]|nr:hypothetical protein G9A89_017710 [Geosiphon pyriformis]